MKILISMVLFLTGIAVAGAPPKGLENLDELPPFERAVQIIKKYETMHRPVHWPLIGYGHMVMPGEKYKRGVQLTEAQADKLLREDLTKMVDLFKDYGDDALLLGVLAYNIGPYKLLGTSGKTPRSNMLKKLQAGNRDIYDDFLSYSNYKGKPHKGLRTRREVEYEYLFDQPSLSAPEEDRI